MTTSTSFDKLSNVRAAFSSWRNQSNRKRQIPKELWLQAISLLDQYPISRVATELRLNQARLREQQAVFKEQRPVKNHSYEQPSFIKVNQFLPLPLTSSQTDSSQLQFQIERVDGARLTLSLNSSHKEMVQVLLTTFIRS